MPPTRRSKPVQEKEASEVALDDGDIEHADPAERPAMSSFKCQVTMFQYLATPNTTTSASPSSTASTRSTKRTRTTTTIASSPSASKKRKPSGYAPPSKYAHLSPLVDILEPNLICVFVGTNPGVQTATAGHAYAHPSNHFWKLLHASGLTDRRLKPSEDRSLPALFCMGNTNIVDRPSKDMAELSKEEMAAGTANLDAKFLRYKPEAVCIVGKGIWEAVWRYRHGRNIKKGEFKYGWQNVEENMGRGKVGVVERDAEGKVWKGSRVFVTTSTSGLAANLSPAEKEAIWKPFGEWVQQRRAEREFVPGSVEAEAEEEEEEEEEEED